jgi:hypothetical protein
VQEAQYPARHIEGNGSQDSRHNQGKGRARPSPSSQANAEIFTTHIIAEAIMIINNKAMDTARA